MPPTHPTPNALASTQTTLHQRTADHNPAVLGHTGDMSASRTVPLSTSLHFIQHQYLVTTLILFIYLFFVVLVFEPRAYTLSH
jgi:hypothetical protein